MSVKPKILRLGRVEFAHQAWERFARVAEIVDMDATNREDFIHDLRTKYQDIIGVSRSLHTLPQTGRFDEELMAHFPPSCGAIANCGAGYDDIDTAALTKRNIQLSNIPSAVDASTADTAMFLVLSALRRFQQGHQGLLEGKWPTSKCAGAPLGHDPAGKTFGILGMGGIGSEIRDRARGFGFGKIVYYNRARLSPELEGGAEYVSFEKLLSQSDIISISIPLNPHTRHLINRETISQMKDGVVLVNTARGGIIDEEAFVDAVKSGKIAAAGLDVYENEPMANEEVLRLENVTTVPHMGSHTYETIQAMEECVIDNLEAFLRTGKVEGLVPEQHDVKFISEGVL
ncbi:hypothetical protein BABINDRAFT_159218 [Babjeviella inositovora NRRL Y-12698]|uniref:Glyoxylate reductase n=1 Tax=Babjeviella inositovora NRRL Y-12698 TaxID=984486 RepID=A0A1E3QYD3_9ASCO|nr:uncharacterized protein BABINDRAFT_159218 [Babjeviella inositovora NRRL Y-12698]ODQ82689.1 hypothetical protein BABINDRAFT_159218 [Babjeviella inositovora NRRL Y-12698]